MPLLENVCLVFIVSLHIFFLLPLSWITSRADQQFPHEIRIIKLSPPDLLAALMDTGYILNSCLVVVVVVDQCLRDRVLKTKTF